MDDGETLLGAWNCSSCGSRGVRGDSYRCHGCGAGRPEDVKFYLPNDAEVVTDAAGIAAANAGSDWKCEFCGQWESATVARCRSCAGGEAARSQRQETSVVETPSTLHKSPEPIRKAVGRAKPTRNDAPHLTVSFRELPQANEGPPVAACIAFTVMVFTTLMIGAIIAFHTRPVPAVITAHSWQRVQHVQEYVSLPQEGWDHPRDAYDIRSESRVHHYDHPIDHYETRTRMVTSRVQDGTERVKTGTRTVNLGNGRFRREPTYSTRTRYRSESHLESYQEPIRRDDPVYRDYYFYKVDRWMESTPRALSGSGLNAQWPSTDVRDAKQRMGSREESYTISLREASPAEGAEPKTWTHPLDESAWRSYTDGMTVTLIVGVADGIREIKSVEEPQK
jgi:hypothetical protein